MRHYTSSDETFSVSCDLCFDRGAIRLVGIIGFAMPPFWVGIILMLFFMALGMTTLVLQMCAQLLEERGKGGRGHG